MTAVQCGHFCEMNDKHFPRNHESQAIKNLILFYLFVNWSIYTQFRYNFSEVFSLWHFWRVAVYSLKNKIFIFVKWFSCFNLHFVHIFFLCSICVPFILLLFTNRILFNWIVNYNSKIREKKSFITINFISEVNIEIVCVLVHAYIVFCAHFFYFFRIYEVFFLRVEQKKQISPTEQIDFPIE